MFRCRTARDDPLYPLTNDLDMSSESAPTTPQAIAVEELKHLRAMMMVDIPDVQEGDGDEMYFTHLHLVAPRPTDADLTHVVDRFLLDALTARDGIVQRFAALYPIVAEQVADITALYQRRITGDDPTQREWSDAWDRAELILEIESDPLNLPIHEDGSTDFQSLSHLRALGSALRDITYRVWFQLEVLTAGWGNHRSFPYSQVYSLGESSNAVLNLQFAALHLDGQDADESEKRRQARSLNQLMADAPHIDAAA